MEKLNSSFEDKFLNAVLTIVVCCIGITSLIGVFWDIPELTDWGGDVQMHFGSAISFTLIGALMTCIRNINHKDFRFTGAMLAGWLMINCLVGAMVNIMAGFLPWFEFVTDNGVNIVPMFPTPVTLLCLWICGFLSLIYFLQDNKKIKVAKYLCLLMSILSLSAFVGHLIDVPIMYFKHATYIPTGLSVPTSIALMLISVFFYMNLTVNAFHLFNVGHELNHSPKHIHLQ